MGDQQKRIDFVQGDAKRIDFEVVLLSPTAGGTTYNLASLATGYFRMRLQPSAIAAVALGASVVNASLGRMNVTAGTQHLASEGQYHGELVLDFGPSIGRETIPKDNPFLVVIRAAV